MADPPKVLILNGPNLNLLGTREPDIYGTTTLDDIGAACRAHGAKLRLGVDCRQTNNEGTLVDWIQEAGRDRAGIVINPGAYTHTSIALMDALTAAAVPTVEVHLSNIHRREPFRRQSYVSKAADGVICGFGAQGYLLALDAISEIMSARQEA